MCKSNLWPRGLKDVQRQHTLFFSLKTKGTKTHMICLRYLNQRKKVQNQKNCLESDEKKQYPLPKSPQATSFLTNCHYLTHRNFNRRRKTRFTRRTNPRIWLRSVLFIDVAAKAKQVKILGTVRAWKVQPQIFISIKVVDLDEEIWSRENPNH